MTYGALARIGVSPDGSGVVFEVSDVGLQEGIGVSVTPTLPPANQGMFYVRSDGTGLRRLGDPSREPSFGASFISPSLAFLDVNFGFSPDGRTITFPDLGPGQTGEETTQIVTLDVVTGKRMQVTHLPPLPNDVGDPWCGVPVTSFPFFLDSGSIAFFTATNPDRLNPGYNMLGFTIGGDGRLTPAPLPVALPGSQIVPKFAITGPEPSAAILPVSGGEGPCAQPKVSFPVVEVFLLDGDSLLQLTNFGRQDTTTAIVGVDRDHVFFNASADPLGTNPSNNCQIFSIDRTGANLRQLTSFSETEHSDNGCWYGLRRGCTADFLWQDPVTQNLVFNSDCDPFGQGYYGAQIFAMRPDGSGLRQLTDTRGWKGTGYPLELPGPFAYSAQIRSLRAP